MISDYIVIYLKHISIKKPLFDRCCQSNKENLPFRREPILNRLNINKVNIPLSL